MIQSVHSVLVGKACPSSYTNADALAVGDVALFDEKGSLITTAALAATAKEIRVGVAKAKINVTLPDGTVAQKANIEYSNVITKDNAVDSVFGTYVAPIQQSIAIALSSATIKVGNSYVLRILYKDLYEDKGQFTHSYEAIAATTSGEDLATALAKVINKHPNRRVNATVASGTLTITAMEKDDNEGVNSINEYSVVNMDAALQEYDNTNAFTGNYPKAVVGATITKTVGTPGKGYWKQVRDAEMRNMPYKGQVFTGAYPSIEADKFVDPSKTYDYAIIGYSNDYLSNDNQYVKSTPLTFELYVEAGKLANSIIQKGIESFLSGVAPTSGVQG